AGRQAITWGTNYFWPALDLFTPFAPDSVDRDYKQGVDTLRLTWPIGAFSEIEAVGAVLGSSVTDNAAAALLARVHLGRMDVGLMGGRFHRDTVAGGFVTADAGGTGLRAELTHTRSGDDADAARGRGRFWRGSAGLDRLLHPQLRAMLEVAWNGFGTADPARYLSEVAPSARIARGEVTALGRWHAGASLAWEVHPLWTIDNTVLANLGDDSAMWVPTARWSTGDETELLFGARVPLGPGPDPSGRARSEYGLATTTVFVRFMAYF
ncbi:MAG: hypothetical protein JJU27_17520, partial [Gammaproteobacteria bacterium]|nr:hypothetical protein [Gammaproteobacteria bacterium]